ncbi:MAG: hypothetical protein IJ598_12835 [Ruminococcus sp.]|nr:hypothetical protein [Ruminococcus sp.]
MKNNRWKADEMETAIHFRAMRCAWIFLVLSLIVWCVVAIISTGVIPPVPMLLVCVSSLIFFTAKTVITNKMTKSGNEDEE